MSKTRGSWISYSQRVKPFARPFSGSRHDLGASIGNGIGSRRNLSKLKSDPIEFYSDSNPNLNNLNSHFQKNFRKTLESSYHLALETNTGTSVTSDNSSLTRRLDLPIPNVIPDMYV